MTNCQVVVRSQFTLKKNKDYGTIDPLKKSFPGCSLFTLHPRSTHPLGFLFYTYFQINSPIRNLLTKAVLKAMTLHAPSMLFQNLPENQSALALPFLDQPRPLVFISHSGTGASESPLSFFFLLGHEQRRPVISTPRLLQPLTPISLFCVDNRPKGSDVASGSCI